MFKSIGIEYFSYLIKMSNNSTPPLSIFLFEREQLDGATARSKKYNFIHSIMNNSIRMFYVKVICWVITVLTIVSCSNDDVTKQITDHIDEIFIRSADVIELSVKDTVSIDVLVNPATTEIDMEMVKGHRLFLQKETDGGGNSEPSAYMIVGVEKKETNEGNAYRLLIADKNTGFGYRDEVQLCFQNLDTVVKSMPFEIKSKGASLFSFSLSDGFTIWEPICVYKDTIYIQVPKSKLKMLTAVFTHNGEGLYLKDKRQNSGDGTTDFSDFCNPLDYIVKGYEGNEHKYTIEIFDLPVVIINTPMEKKLKAE